MTDANQLIRGNMMEYKFRIKHLDERIVHADKAVGKGPEHVEVRGSLANLIQQHDKFTSFLDELRLKSLENWRVDEIEKAGPMGGMPLASNWRNWSSVLNAK